MAGVGRPENEDGAFTALGSDLQAPQLARQALRQPGKHRRGRVRPQKQLSCPEPLGRGFGLYPDQAVLVEAEVAQAGQVRWPGRPNDDDGTAAVDQRP